MATALLSPVAKQYFPTNAGTPAAGYKLYTYAANTTTPQATFTNRAGTVANQNPIILDARGEAIIYLTPGVVYDYHLYTDQDALEYTREDVIADAGDANAVSFLQSGAGAVSRSSQDKMRERVSLLDFIPVSLHAGIAAGTDVTDLSSYIQIAADRGGRIYAPAGVYNHTSKINFQQSNTDWEGDGKGRTRFVCGLAATAAFQVGDHPTAPVDVHFKDMTISRAVGTVPANSVGIYWASFNYGAETNVHVDRHDYGRYIHHNGGSTSIGYCAWNATASDCQKSYLRVGEAADVNFVSAKFGKNGVDAFAPESCVEFNGQGNAINFTDCVFIPTHASSNTTTQTIYWKGVTGTTGVYSFTNCNTENVKHCFTSDASTATIYELKIIGGRWTCSGANTHNFSYPTTRFVSMSLTGVVFGGAPTTINNVKWGNVAGGFFADLTLNSDDTTNGNGDISLVGGTIAGTLTLNGTWTRLDAIGQTYSSLTDTASNNGNVSYISKERMRLGSGLVWDADNLNVGRVAATVRNEKLSVKSNAGQIAAQLYCVDATASNYHTVFTSNVGGTEVDKCVIRADGNLLNSNNSYGAISDERFKENIALAASQWDDVKAIQLINYNLIGDSLRQLGVSAQQARGVSPGLVTETQPTDEAGNPTGEPFLGFQYSVLYLKAVGALQEAMARIEALEQKQG